jgi:hypothetical protein
MADKVDEFQASRKTIKKTLSARQPTFAQPYFMMSGASRSRRGSGGAP